MTGFGILVGGVPVGDTAYVRQCLSQKAATVVSKVNTVSDVLRPLHLQALQCCTYYGLNSLFHHWVRHCLPEDVLEAACQVDSAVLRVARACHGDAVTTDPYAAARLRLPARMYGGGLRSAADVAPAAFLGALCQTIPRMLPRTSADGDVCPGFMPQLVDLLGPGSFDAGAEDTRFATFLSGRSRLAGALRNSWEGLRAELPDTPGALRQGAEAAGNGCANLQRELTGLRETSRFRQLDVSIRALPIDDIRRAAWLNMDKFSTVWVSTWPSPDCRVSNAEFSEIAARYFGLPSPACAPLVGQVIGNTRSFLDAHGSRLAAASLPGDGFRTQHDAIKWRLDEDMREMGMRSRTEVYGLFAAVLPQHARETVSQWPMRKRQGLVPDFVVALPQAGQNPSEAVDELFELKTLHHGTTTYPAAVAPRSRAVDRRSDALPGEQATKARRLDQRFCGTQVGEVGPVSRRLASYGAVRGLVVGHWAEGSSHMEDLLSGAAHTGSLRHWGAMRAREPTDALGTLAWILRRRWGMAAWRSAARLLLDRLEFVGRGAVAALSRRAAASERAAAARRDAHWLFRRR